MPTVKPERQISATDSTPASKSARTKKPKRIGGRGIAATRWPPKRATRPRPSTPAVTCAPSSRIESDHEAVPARSSWSRAR